MGAKWRDEAGSARTQTRSKQTHTGGDGQPACSARADKRADAASSTHNRMRGGREVRGGGRQSRPRTRRQGFQRAPANPSQAHGHGANAANWGARRATRGRRRSWTSQRSCCSAAKMDPGTAALPLLPAGVRPRAGVTVQRRATPLTPR